MKDQIVINGKVFLIKATSPARFKALQEIEKTLSDWMKENPNTIFIFNEGFRGQYWMKTAELILDPVDGQFPPLEFFASDEFEFSQLEKAVSFFVLRQG